MLWQTEMYSTHMSVPIQYVEKNISNKHVAVPLYCYFADIM